MSNPRYNWSDEIAARIISEDCDLHGPIREDISTQILVAPADYIRAVRATVGPITMDPIFFMTERNGSNTRKSLRALSKHRKPEPK